jgi:hypothetical protein
MGAEQKHTVAEAASRNAKRTSTTYHVCTVGVSKVDQVESCAFKSLDSGFEILFRAGLPGPVKCGDRRAGPASPTSWNGVFTGKIPGDSPATPEQSPSGA